MLAGVAGSAAAASLELEVTLTLVYLNLGHQITSPKITQTQSFCTPKLVVHMLIGRLIMISRTTRILVEVIESVALIGSGRPIRAISRD